MMYGYIRVLAAVACVGVVAGFAAGGRGAGAAALGTAEADARVGGACANTKCAQQSCDTADRAKPCDVSGNSPVCQLVVVQNVAMCRMVQTNPGQICNVPAGKNVGWDCKPTTEAILCAEEWRGAPYPTRSCVSETGAMRCTASGVKCGNARSKCDETPCQSGN